MKLFFTIIIIFFSVNIFSQNKDTINLETVTPLNLEEVVIYGKKDSREERIKRYRIRRRLKKVWKYAVLTQEELEKLERVLNFLKKKKQKKKHLKLVEKFLRKNFEETLKKFYIQDGQILLKMIYRQTGRTIYDISTQFKSKWTAFWWNSTAYFFEMSLKSEYLPNDNAEDFLIEKYLQELFDEGTLERKPPFDECINC